MIARHHGPGRSPSSTPTPAQSTPGDASPQKLPAPHGPRNTGRSPIGQTSHPTSGSSSTHHPPTPHASNELPARKSTYAALTRTRSTAARQGSLPSTQVVQEADARYRVTFAVPAQCRFTVALLLAALPVLATQCVGCGPQPSVPRCFHRFALTDDPRRLSCQLVLMIAAWGRDQTDHRGRRHWPCGDGCPLPSV